MKYRPHIIALLLISVLIVFAFGDVISGASILSFRDHTDVFRPTFQFVVDNILDAQLPLGPMYSQSGTALEHQLNGTYTPLTLVLFAMPYDLAYDWYVIAHYILLGFGTYFFARHLGAELHEAITAAVISSLAGPVLACENLVSALHGLAFAPWVYWTMDRLLLKASPRRLACFAIALSFQVQGAIPIVLLMNVLVGGLLFYHRKSLLRPVHLLVGGGAFVLAFGMAAIEIGGVIEYLPLSRRGQGFPYEEAARWSLSSGQLLEFFIPSMWWPPDRPYILAAKHVGSDMPPYFITLYLGCALPLAIGATISAGRKRIAWLLVFFLVLIVAMGPISPIHRWLTHLPLLKSSRFPVKYTLILVPAVAYLATRIFRETQQMSIAIFICAVVHLVLCSTLLYLSTNELFVEYLASVLIKLPTDALPIGVNFSEYANIAANSIQERALHATCFSLGIVLLIGFLATRKENPPAWTKWALCGLLVLDLSLGARFTVFGGPLEPNSPPPEIIDTIASLDHFVFVATPQNARAQFQPIEGETDFASSVRSGNLRGHITHKRIRFFRDIDRNGLSPQSASLAISALQTSNLREALRVFERAGTAWMSSYQPGVFQDHLTLDIENEQTQYFYRLPPVRSYVANHFEWKFLDLNKMNPQEQADYVKGLDPKVAFVTSPLSAELNPSCTSSTATATTTYTRDKSQNRIDVISESTCPRLVSVLETLMPNWRVYVDDQAAPMYNVDFGQIGTLLPPGKQKIRFQYEPSSGPWIKLSAISWLLALLLLFLPSRKRETAHNPSNL